MIKPLRLLWVSALALLAAACSKDTRDPCLEPRIAGLRVECKHRVDSAGTLGDTLLPNPLLYPVDAQTAYFFGGLKRISQFNLTLSEVADSCSWILRTDSAVAVQDTLSFHYQRQLHFISNACGYTYFYQLDRVSTTRHSIDSSVILKAEISTNASGNNLRLIF